MESDIQCLSEVDKELSDYMHVIEETEINNIRNTKV